MKQRIEFTITLPWPDNVTYGAYALDGSVGQPLRLSYGDEVIAAGTIVGTVVDPIARRNFITLEREIEFDEPTDPLARVLLGLDVPASTVYWDDVSESS